VRVESSTYIAAARDTEFSGAVETRADLVFTPKIILNGTNVRNSAAHTRARTPAFRPRP
jgi:hypothetical protein